MSVVTGSLTVDLLLAALTVIYLLYWYITNNDGYWDKRHVVNSKERYFFKTLIGKESQAELIKRFYQKNGDKRYIGFFQFRKPIILVRDPELIHKIMVKDFTHFQDRGQPRIKKDPMSNNLFNLTGQEWRNLRYKLTPTFTTGKLKGMFDQVSKCGENMMSKIEELSQKNSEIDTKAFMFEFTSDVISSCAFGLQFEPKSQEFEQFKQATNKIFRVSVFSFAKFAIMFLFPKVASLLSISFSSKETTEYFSKLTNTTIKYRKENNIKRNDYLQLLMTLKEHEDSGRGLGLSMSDATEDDAIIDQMKYTKQNDSSCNMKLFTEDTICANAFIFLVAGSESTSSTISFVLYELARHPDVQERLQQEVNSVLARHNGSWSYQAIKEMTYLDQVVQEGQRLYPVLPIIQRECVEPYAVPESDLVIEKGVLVHIPAIALHTDPQYYPEPEKFKPERFEGNNFKPSPTYLPYGDGPRICIAMRFAVMEVKTCIAKIMSQYKVKLSPKTAQPLKLDPRSFVPFVKDGIWLTFEKANLTKLSQ